MASYANGKNGNDELGSLYISPFCYTDYIEGNEDALTRSTHGLIALGRRRCKGQRNIDIPLGGVGSWQ
jgi:hypothetical protein